MSEQEDLAAMVERIEKTYRFQRRQGKLYVTDCATGLEAKLSAEMNIVASLLAALGKLRIES